MNDEVLNRVEEKTNVSKDTIISLAKKLEDSGLNDEVTIREVIKSLSTITNKDVPKEKEDKIADMIMKNNIPNNIDKMF